jgi:hypothetical protein
VNWKKVIVSHHNILNVMGNPESRMNSQDILRKCQTFSRTACTTRHTQAAARVKKAVTIRETMMMMVVVMKKKTQKLE